MSIDGETQIVEERGRHGVPNRERGWNKHDIVGITINYHTHLSLICWGQGPSAVCLRREAEYSLDRLLVWQIPKSSPRAVLQQCSTASQREASRACEWSDVLKVERFGKVHG